MIEAAHVGPWRKPDEETLNLYPNLVVHDGRQSGSITIGRSRLPIWSIIMTAIGYDWDEVEYGWSPTENYNFTERDLSEFLYHLLEMRGEFGRLLLVLANAERQERDLQDLAIEEAITNNHPGILDEDGGLINVTPGKEEAVELPGPWWADPDLVAPVREQLQRCLEALDSGVEQWREEMKAVDKEMKEAEEQTEGG